MYSGLITGHILVIGGCFLAAWNVTVLYMNLLSSKQGTDPVRKPRLTDGLALLSGMLLIAGGVCYIVHWIIDYRLIPACQ